MTHTQTDKSTGSSLPNSQKTDIELLTNELKRFEKAGVSYKEVQTQHAERSKFTGRLAGGGSFEILFSNKDTKNPIHYMRIESDTYIEPIGSQQFSAMEILCAIDSANEREILARNLMPGQNAKANNILVLPPSGKGASVVQNLTNEINRIKNGLASIDGISDITVSNLEDSKVPTLTANLSDGGKITVHQLHERDSFMLEIQSNANSYVRYNDSENKQFYEELVQNASQAVGKIMHFNHVEMINRILRDESTAR